MTPEKALRQLQRKYALALDQLSGQLARGDINCKDYMRRGLALVRDAHARADYLGQVKAGVRTRFDATQKLAGIRIAQEELTFLRGFRDDLAAGRYKPRNRGGKGAMARKARAMLYAKKLVGTANEAWAKEKRRRFQEALRSASAETRKSRRIEPAKNADRTVYARWVLGIAEHCRSCLDEAAKGWRPLSDFDRFPGDGGTRCLANCKCGLETETGEAGFTNARVGEGYVVQEERTPLEIEARRVEGSIRSRGYEVGFILDLQGNRLLKTDSDPLNPSVMRLPPEAEALAKGNVFIHNHPRSTSFSLSDVATAAGMQMAEMRIVSKKFNYSIKPPKDGWSKETFGGIILPAFMRVRSEVTERLDRMESQGEIDADEVALRMNHEIWESLSKEKVVSYSRKPRRR